MPEKFHPPFTVQSTNEAFWIADAEGQRFGYIYFRDQPIMGTDKSGRVSRELAEKTVRWIARMATEAAKASGPE